jgi:hypothetical protein
MTKMVNDIYNEGFTKVVEGDGSAFDNTQDVKLKEVDRYLYKKVEHAVYHVPKKQFRDISQRLEKVMKIKYIENHKQKTMMKYTILGSVFSGDCDTTLCNTLRMALYNIYVNEKYGLKYGVDYKAISKGDDFTVFYKPYITDKQIHEIYENYFLTSADDLREFGLGQVLKMLNIGDPTSLSFCSLKAYAVNNTHTKVLLVRNPEKFMNLSKYSRKSKTMTIKQKIEYLIQQAVALRIQYGGIRIFEWMAIAYETQAVILAQNKFEVLQKCLKPSVEKIYDARKVIEQFDRNYAETPEYQLLYGIKHRKMYYKIRDSYWETMKLLQDSATKQLTQEEAEYVNQQIELDISTEYFKSNMGLNNTNIRTKKCQEKLTKTIIEQMNKTKKEREIKDHPGIINKLKMWLL